MLIGFLFAFLFELPGFFIMAGIGTFLFILGLSLLKNSQDVSIFDLQPRFGNQPRNCVQCGRSIPFDARLCPYCGHNYEPTPQLTPNIRSLSSKSQTTNIPQSNGKFCKACGNKIEQDIKFCPFCGSEL